MSAVKQLNASGRGLWSDDVLFPDVLWKSFCTCDITDPALSKQAIFGA